MMAAGWMLEWGSDHRARQIDRPLVIGRGREADVVLTDPFVSRRHCIVAVEDGRPYVDSRGSLNHVSVGGRAVDVAVLASGDSFVVGVTPFRVWSLQGVDDAPTEPLSEAPGATRGARLVLRCLSRELVDHQGTLIARFSPSECLAFEEVARRYPEVATFGQLGAAVWGGIGFDQFQLQRLMGRVRDRLGHSASLLQNIRGAGYRVSEPIIMA